MAHLPNEDYCFVDRKEQSYAAKFTKEFIKNRELEKTVESLNKTIERLKTELDKAKEHRRKDDIDFDKYIKIRGMYRAGNIDYETMCKMISGLMISDETKKLKWSDIYEIEKT